MDQVGEVSSVIQDHVEGLTVLEVQGLLDAPHVLLVRLALPGVHYTEKDDNQSDQEDVVVVLLLLLRWETGRVLVVT